MTGALRIRFVATRYPHWGAHAGIGQFTRHLGPGFEADYHLVNDDDSQLPVPVKAWRDRLRARVQRSGMAWYKLSDLAAEMRAAGACAAGRADLVHFLDGEHGVQFLPKWLDRLPRRRQPIVASYHQTPDLLPGLVDPAVVRRLDAVVLVSPEQEPFFRRVLPEERVVTILHGVDTDFFRPGASKRDDGVIRCVTAGHWLRDWTAMRRAAEDLKDRSDIEFHVVTGRETGLEGLPNVRFHKGLSDEALLGLYQSADIALLPLEASTANNSLLECLAVGLPLLSTDLASVRTYVGKADALLLPGGSAGYAEAILALAGDPARRAAMGRTSRERALDLAWPRIARQYAALYQGLTE